MSISIKSRKAKGRKLQQWCAGWISTITGIPHGKDKDIQSREMGQSGVDVKLYGEARELFPFACEAKNSETWSIPAWIKQAKENQADGTHWLLICKKNHHEEIAILDARTFFRIWQLIIENGCQNDIKIEGEN